MPSNPIPPSHKILDSFPYPPFVFNADGTISRNCSMFPRAEANPDSDSHTQVLTKDIPVNQSKNTSVRIFLPRQALDSSTSTKLPLIVYFHGGGFVLCSSATSIYHDLCQNFATKLSAVIASVDYRLAPEHRLPAAYDDAVDVLHCIKTSQEDWLQKYVDFSSCYLMGDSAGGNIAYHAGLRAVAQVDNLFPLKIKGLILYKPFFGGEKRTETELRIANDPEFPSDFTDLMWALSLPIGVDRDHEYCNPMVGDGLKLLEKFKPLGLKVMVTGGFGDPLFDRQIELLKIMEQKGVKVVSHFDDSRHRTEDFCDPVKRMALYGYVKDFISSPTVDAQ
ncbi:carboxylesterase 1-like [Melia azedarach]|uniref:Carboxylesterase 1-like n=1 Tax=Melia azedarach TaxID=155640 RepID=A0ACC1X4U5_MELAZ|nr:carboxylesterase 1-like [Melia azedarach]